MSIFFIEDKNGDYFSADGKRRFIRLTGKAAYDYFKSPNGRGKRFYKLSAEDETEDDVFIEIPSSKISHIRNGERRTQYVADCKKKADDTKSRCMLWKQTNTAKGVPARN